MAEQWKTGLVTVTNASQIVIGTASCDWVNQIALPGIFKVDLDNETTISVGTIISATRLHLAANYTGSTNSGMSYMICRSFTTSRGYWRVLAGDNDFAEILSQETIDPIDEDISHIMSGNATVDGTIGTSFGIDTDGNCLRIKSTNFTASRQYHFPDYNASIPSKNASQDWAETQRFNILTASILKTNDPVDENGVGDRGYYSDLVTENGIEEIWYSSTGDIVETTKTQTLTNKRLTSPKINEDVALTGTATQIEDAVTKKHTQNTDTGTTSTSFKINSGGSEADIKTTKLSGDRNFEFPDIDGLISISEITANNSFECIAYT